MVGAPFEREDEPVVVEAEGRGALQDPDLGRRSRARPRRRRPTPGRGGRRSARRCRAATRRPRAGRPASTTRTPERAAVRAAARPAGPAPTTSTSQWTFMASYRAGSGSVASRPCPGRPVATSPSYSSTVVAGSIGSGNGASIWTSALGSSGPAAMMPRGRPSRMLVATWCTPFASSAEARVSPGCPVYVAPPNVKRQVDAAVDPAARRAARHRPPLMRSPASARRCGRRASSSWVAVSRTALNQRRQPAEWHQRSAKAPLGLSRKNR